MTGSVICGYFCVDTKSYHILASGVTGWVLISAFTYLVGIPIGITSSVIELKICALTPGIK